MVKYFKSEKLVSLIFLLLVEIVRVAVRGCNKNSLMRDTSVTVISFDFISLRSLLAIAGIALH